MDEIGIFFEGFIADHWKELTRIKAILEGLRRCEGASSPFCREKVQGGESTPVALRRVELLDALDRCYPPLVDLVRVFEAQTDKKRIAYCHALIDGVTDMKSRGIGAAKHRECRSWLTREMLRIEKRHGIR